MSYLPYIIYCLILILFFLGGYLLGLKETEVKKKHNPLVQLKQPDKVIKHNPSGVIEFPSQEEIDYHESGEEKTDQARTELFEKYFKP